jgi:FkbM family methyltransferase
MKIARRKIEELLWVLGLHGSARSVFRVTAGREAFRVRELMKSFYKGLLPPNALVFDIGANVGAMSAVFSSLGSKVVAVEPNSDCIRHIKLSYPQARIEVIQAVAGAKNGLATLNMSDERDDISSVSTDWIKAMQREHDSYSHLWSKQITVPMVTLDSLVEHFGLPQFIKIDVEGYEESVLDGLSVQPSLLSFEFNMAFLDAAMNCLEKPIFQTGSLFNFALGDPVRFELDHWSNKSQLKEALLGMQRGDMHGDIFVKTGTSADLIPTVANA